MGCTTSSPSKDLLRISPANNKVTEVFKNGREKVQHSLNETINDVSDLDFLKAQEDLQQVGMDLEASVTEGMNELLGNESDEKNKTEMVKGDGNPSSVTPAENSASPPTLEEESPNMNTPIPSLDTVNENETEDIMEEKSNETEVKSLET